MGKDYHNRWDNGSDSGSDIVRATDPIAMQAQQEAHYRKKEGFTTKKASRPEGREDRAPRVAPAASSSPELLSQSGPFPSVNSNTKGKRSAAAALQPPAKSVTKRKAVPVPGAEPAAEASSAANASQQRAPTRPQRDKGHRHTDNRPQPETGDILTINRSGSGKFYPANATPQNAATFVPPTEPTVPFPTYKDPSSPSTEKPPLHRPNSFRDALASTFGRNRGESSNTVKKADANPSSSSAHPNPNPNPNPSSSESRKESFGAQALEVVRRWSGNFKDGAKEFGHIVFTDKSGRNQIKAEKFAARPSSPERESERRVNPLSRPAYQQEALLAKNVARGRPDLAQDNGNLAADYAAMIAQSEKKRLMNVAMHAKWMDAVRDADIAGRPIPPSPAYTETAILELTEEERAALRLSAAEPVEAELKPKTLPVMSKAAFNVSAVFDPIKIKPKRSATMESEMSFADNLRPEQAPGLMRVCTECNHAPRDYLHADGRCQSCHKAERELRRKKKGGDFTSREQGQTGSTDPDSPPFMKVAAAKKLRKVRQTIYEGNPFNVAEATDEVSLLSIPFRPMLQKSKSESQSQSRSKPAREGHHQLLTGTPFADAVESPTVLRVPELGISFVTTLHAPMPQRQVTSAMVKKAHRSMSVIAIPVDAAGSQDFDREYVPQRAGWRRGRVPAVSGVGDAAERERGGVRDTVFYGFYDDLLPEYSKKRESRL
ncbi:hypothetical protein B0A55_03093 [Friedmanniomyces simplex]|uniref:Uncharacterized protein n=1 Tax=Friedmanniomyces simplex TaxID=329884 RepID=A0A4U0XJ19_9PEZI|nr:hypothetical protein B0A55_03093 [Friedmanniomyces simplex]